MVLCSNFTAPVEGILGNKLRQLGRDHINYSFEGQAVELSGINKNYEFRIQNFPAKFLKYFQILAL